MLRVVDNFQTCFFVLLWGFLHIRHRPRRLDLMSLLVQCALHVSNQKTYEIIEKHIGLHFMFTHSEVHIPQSVTSRLNSELDRMYKGVYLIVQESPECV